MTTDKNKLVRMYFPPLIERIALDNKISLALESNPPYPGNEGMNKTPEYMKNDPYKMA